MAKQILIKHIENPREISLRSSSADHHASDIATASKFSSISLSKSKPQEKESETHKNNPIHHTPSSSSSSSCSLSSSSSSVEEAAAASSLLGNNEDLLWQILPYLPHKALLRFQCVSKQWLSIISDPAFRLLHSRIYPTTTPFPTNATGLFLYRSLIEITDINFVSLGQQYANSSLHDSLSNLSNFLKGKVVDFHSCNGLLAIVVRIRVSKSYHEEIVVYNPTTRQHRLIPRIGPLPEYCSLQHLNIVFDPSKSEHYKVLYVWWAWGCEYYPDLYRFKVYSSETRVWRESKGGSSTKDDELKFKKGVLWNGDIHWISAQWYTLCFDLENECLRPRMPSLPETTDSRPTVLFFGVSGENLCVIAEKLPRTMHLNVFELERDYSRWNFKYYFLSPLTALYPSVVDQKWQILCIPANKKPKKSILILSLPGKVISYDTKDMIVKEIAEVVQVANEDPWLDKTVYGWIDAYQHWETLACV